jgi:hypothetical protein
MGKKQMSIHLDEDAVRVVRNFLEPKGQNFSAWVNAFVMEFAKELQGQPSPLGKAAEDMTIKEFQDIMNYWMNKVAGTGGGDETEAKA